VGGTEAVNVEGREAANMGRRKAVSEDEAGSGAAAKIATAVKSGVIARARVTVNPTDLPGGRTANPLSNQAGHALNAPSPTMPP
jgi:hypothetical protein